MPSSIEFVRQWYMGNGTPVPQGTFKEAASQSFKRGHLVTMASGKVTAAVAAGSNLAASGNEIFGVALKDATGTTDSDIPVALISEGFRMVLPVTHATAASAITAITQIGTAYELENVTGKGYAVAIDDTSSPCATVRKMHPQYATGEQYGWVEVEFVAAEKQVP